MNNSENGNLKTAVEGIMRVHTIPVIMKRIQDVVENEFSTITDLVDVVERDQALASKIVGTANTAFYGFRRNIRTIPSAVFILGFNMVKSLVVSVTLFNCAAKGSSGFLKNLWKHSLEVGAASGLIAERTGLMKKEEAFLAGLIHDLGRAILYQIYGEQYLMVAEDGPNGLLIREEAAFGATHSQVGAWFVEKYKFPKECALALQFHHAPEKCLTGGNALAQHLTYTVYLADFILSEDKGNSGVYSAVSPYHAEIMRSIYLDEEGLEDIREKLAAMEDIMMI